MQLLMFFCLALLALVIYLIAPAKNHHRADAWRRTPFAHRGLHGDGVCENTLEAFERACQAGFGIELDIQLTRDGEVVVFHDLTLERLTGDPHRVDELTLDEVQKLTLDSTDAHIPTFQAALDLIHGRVPLLVELKSCMQNRRLCAKAVALLKDYEGAYVVESFNPLMLRSLRKLAPEIIRGQLVSAFASYRAFGGRIPSFILSTLSLNFLARPDFVSYQIDPETGFRAPKIQRSLFHTPLAAWTVRDPETFSMAVARGEMPIFEGFLPDEREISLE